VAKRKASDQAPRERSVLLPVLLALLALVGIFNVLMGAYLYTAYQNHRASRPPQSAGAEP